mmetsp:Transcript_5342/g.11024  ORF Transcript_5342/g.11024 Transcript_5342/m.11024 type:complete len:112 (+) Transcript_5342:1853-2188(+)
MPQAGMRANKLFSRIVNALHCLVTIIATSRLQDIRYKFFPAPTTIASILIILKFQTHTCSIAAPPALVIAAHLICGDKTIFIFIPYSVIRTPQKAFFKRPSAGRQWNGIIF